METSWKLEGNIRKTEGKPKGNLRETLKGHLRDTQCKGKGDLRETSKKPNGN